MKKRTFQILDEMNQHDIENHTRLVAVSGDFVSADKVRQGTKICMGASDEVLHDLLTDKVVPILVIVNKEEYQKRNKE